MSKGGPTGSVTTGKWIRDGIVFEVYDQATMDLLQEVPVNATVLGCVSNAPGNPRGMAGEQHTNWMDHPSRRVCGSCHTNINFETGEGHIVQTTDVVATIVMNLSVRNLTPRLQALTCPCTSQPSYQVSCLNSLTSRTPAPAKSPTVTFSVGGKNGRYNPADMNRLNLRISGSNEDFSFDEVETVGDNAVASGSNWKYTFDMALPDDASGSWTVSMEGRVDADVNYGGTVEGERDYAQNVWMEFAVTNATAEPRRVVVDNEKCESCHSSISLHGGNRTQAQYCVTCHNPTLVDIADPAESVNQRWMIHKIHRGADLENGYVVIRSRGTYDFSHVEYSGDLRNCEACHVNGSEQLPLPSGLLDQLTPNFWWTEVATGVNYRMPELP